MSQRRKPAETPELPALLGEIAQGAGQLVSQQFELLRAELRQELAQAGRGALSIGAGSVLIASGGALSAFMAVHGLHRATRLPLWACYGIVGGGLSIVGAGFLARGRRELAALELAPQTAAALEENLAWIQDQLTAPDR